MPHRPKPYRQDFYIPRNIIGYTGDLHFWPTVYFQFGHEFGHITQHHLLGENVGREQVDKSSRYRIANHYRNGKIVSTEWIGLQLIHPSRNPLITRDRFGPGDLLTLCVAIYRFPDIKPRYPLPHAEKAGQPDIVKSRRAFHTLLQSQFALVRDHRLDLFVSDQQPRATNVMDRVVYGGVYRDR